MGKRLPEAISIKHTAELLDVHENTVRRWIRMGIIKASRVGPQLIRIPRSEISRLRSIRMPLKMWGDQPDYPPAYILSSRQEL